MINLLIKRQSCHHIDPSQLSCSANQLIGFYMIATLAFNGLSMCLGSKGMLRNESELINFYFLLN